MKGSIKGVTWQSPATRCPATEWLHASILDVLSSNIGLVSRYAQLDQSDFPVSSGELSVKITARFFQ